MKEIKTYGKAIIEIGSKFLGLRPEQTTLIKSLIPLADPDTGIVSDISYNELAKILTVTPSSGRKNSGTPTKQTIRNFIKSIERECGEYFQIISEGQQLKFLFPELPKIFSKLFKNTEVNTELNLGNTLTNTGLNSVFDDEVNTHLNTELNTPNPAVKNNIILIKNKQTKQTNSDTAIISSAKKPITENFYPDAETIEIALSKGYINVIEPNEIAAFIQHNKTKQTQWTDFNPVYLRWLERQSEYQAQQKQRAQKQLGRKINEHRTHQKPIKLSAIDTVAQLHGISPVSIWDEPNEERSAYTVIEGTFVEVMDENDGYLRSALC